MDNNLTSKLLGPQKIVSHKELKSSDKELTRSLLKVGVHSQGESGKRENIPHKYHVTSASGDRGL